MADAAGIDAAAGSRTPDGPAWQDRAVARSLERARADAADRSSRIVDAAFELAEASPNGDFTVQQVVDHIQMSTRTFYQHFRGKDDLMVAMFEEIQRSGVRILQEAVDASTDPLERLRAFVLVRQQNVRDTPLTRMMILHHFRLQELRADELRHALEPVVAQLRELVTTAAEAGVIRVDDVDTATTLILQTVTTAIQSRVLGVVHGDTSLTPDDVWQYCLHGLGGPAVEG